MSTKRERAEIIERLAFEMAASGKYRDYMDIEIARRRAMGRRERSLIVPRLARC